MGRVINVTGYRFGARGGVEENKSGVNKGKNAAGVNAGQW